MAFTCKTPDCPNEVSAYQFASTKYGCYCGNCSYLMEHPETASPSYKAEQKAKWDRIITRLEGVCYPYEGWDRVPALPSLLPASMIEDARIEDENRTAVLEAILYEPIK